MPDTPILCMKTRNHEISEFRKFAQLNEREVGFLKNLIVLDNVWGYRSLSTYELRTHAHSTDLQRYTDPIFRTISKLIQGEVVHADFDIYDKLRGCIEIDSPRSVALLNDAFREERFEEEFVKLANYKAETFQMKIIVEFANAVLDLSEWNSGLAFERMLPLRKILKDNTN